MNTDLKAALVSERDAITARIEAAAEAEKALLKTQFGQRLLHLEERIKAFAEPPAAG